MVGLQDVIITAELDRRPARAPNYEAETRALVHLSAAMSASPDMLLQTLADVAMELCGAETAGVSLLEEHQGRPVFRWRAIAGKFKEHLMGMAPADFSPCGLVVDSAKPQLLSYPGRHFSYLDEAEPRIVESLLIPFFINKQPVGTVWILAHDENRKFDAEDVRLLNDLGEFCSAAVHVLQAEDLRWQSVKRVQMIIQNLPDYAIFMIDPHGVVTEWSEGAERVKGYKPHEVIGQHVSIFYLPEDIARGTVDEELRVAATTGRAEREGWRVRKGGERFWGNEIMTAVHDSSGRLTGFTKIARDLGTRKAVEDALRESEARHRLLLENVRDHAIMTTDTQGLIQTWNPGSAHIFGYTASEIIGKNGSILFTPEDRVAGEHEKELATAAREGRASDDRWQMRKDGTRFWASGISTAMRDATGELVGFIKVLRDLTPTKLIEEQRNRLFEQEKAARIEAERAMTMKDEFIAVVSHELRTPLSAILLWSKMLRDGNIQLDKELLSEALETIERSAVAQQQLIEDLLDVSRMLSGQLRINVTVIELDPVIHSAVEAVRPMADAKGVEVELSLDGNTGHVRADPDRMQQVVWNLVNNAVKFTSRGGKVSIALTRNGTTLQIRVTDTGQGIDPAFLPFVFDRFRQADATATRRHGGLGLGLAITRQLVELHGGTIRAESAGEGKGSSFTVELPLADVGADLPSGNGNSGGIAATSPVQLSPVLKGLRVLVVEDEPHTRSAIQWLLQRCEAEVTSVDSAAAALSAFRNTPDARAYDVVISDISMPSQDGYELMTKIRDAERAAGKIQPTPAIALTAYARDEDREKAISSGFQLHVAKPVEPAELVNAVATLAGRAGSPR